MARTSISSVITADFINRFREFASSLSPSSGSLTSFLQGGASTASISSGLRFGAQAFSASIQGLNAAISYVNLAGDDLQKLRGITSELITITERATKPSTSESTRRSLDVEFQRLGSQFNRIIENSALRGVDYLSSDGLSEVFKQFGLDEEQSQSIAKIFESFKLTKTDSELASERIKGGRPVTISVKPPSSYIQPDTYVMERISTTGVLSASGAGISSELSAYVGSPSFFGSNVRSLILTTTGSTTSSIAGGTGALGSDIRAVDEVNGYVLIQSKNDFLGYNPSGYNQLYIVNSAGVVVQQVTDNTEARTYDEADLSSSGLTVLATTTESDTSHQVYHFSIGSFGTNPASVSSNRLESGTPGAEAFYNPKVSNEGTYFAYGKDDGLGSEYIQFYDNALSAPEAALASKVNRFDITQFGFGDVDSLILIDLVSLEIQRYDHTTTLSTSILSLDSPVGSDFTVLQENGSNNAHFAFFNQTDDTLYLYSLDSSVTAGTLVTTLSLGTGAAVNSTSLSIAHNSYGSADVGIRARLPVFGSDTDYELYRFRYRPLSQLPVSTKEVETIFEGSIATRQDAYRTLADLKALRDQIDTNIKNLETASEIIEQNITLVRAAGEALLDLSSQLDDSDDAAEVARKLQSEIRRRASAALNQIENLDPILVATLTQQG